MSVQLKPCPFCGGEARLSHKHNMVQISCNACGATTLWTHEDTEDFIIQKWNKRKRKSQFIRECPFCGKKAKLREAYDGTFIVQCSDCANSSSYYYSSAEAISSWNKRFEEDNDE